jgi:hypothetical protein
MERALAVHPARMRRPDIGAIAMEDRGDKIISLAREMLRNNVEVPPAAPPGPSISFKVLCMASCLAAFGGGFVTAVNNEQHRPLNRYEKTELEALIFYIARTKGTDEDTLRKGVEAKLGIASFDDMNEDGFRTARRYLQERAL